jgi:hypothetical protein
VPERIVWTGILESDGNETVTTIMFADRESKTKLTMLQTFSIETDSTRGTREDWPQTLEHLAQDVATLWQIRARICRRRKMEASTNLVTEPRRQRARYHPRLRCTAQSRLQSLDRVQAHGRWFGPRGFKSLRNELRPGGAYRIHMLGPEGDHWSQGVYRVVPLERTRHGRELVGCQRQSRAPRDHTGTLLRYLRRTTVRVPPKKEKAGGQGSGEKFRSMKPARMNQCESANIT